MKRRDFLQKTSSAVTLPILLNGMGVQVLNKSSMFNSMGDSDKVLVLVQLNGGNDGLNMVLPLDQYANLANARPNILIPDNQALLLDNDLGFHPNMGGMKNLYDEGRLSIVQSVAYPNQNRSHFRSTDIWTSGSPSEEVWRTGWLGRYFEQDHSQFPEGYPNSTNPDPFAITLGNLVSETCQGTAANFSMALTDPFSLTPLAQGGDDDVPQTPYGYELQFLRTSIAQTNEYSDTIMAAANGGANLVTYPDDNRLAQQLKIVAQLISGGLQTSVYVVSLGGFDTHANQVNDGDTVNGGHAQLLATLSEAIEVFQSDIEALNLQERVVGMTFSEFGRRILSNDSLGTDHGTAAPLMLFGTCVNPTIFGENPEIPDAPTIQEGVPMQFDFRSIYGSILMDWFGISENTVKGMLYDDFQHIPVINNCQVSTSTGDAFRDPLESSVFPNPFGNWTTIKFASKGEDVRISIFDALGHEIKVVSSAFFPQGEHSIQVDMSGLSSGKYFYYIRTKDRTATKGMIKQ